MSDARQWPFAKAAPVAFPMVPITQDDEQSGMVKRDDDEDNAIGCTVPSRLQRRMRRGFGADALRTGNTSPKLTGQRSDGREVGKRFKAFLKSENGGELDTHTDDLLYAVRNSMIHAFGTPDVSSLKKLGLSSICTRASEDHAHVTGFRSFRRVIVQGVRLVQPGARRHGSGGIGGNVRHFRICSLQILKGPVGFESHPLRQINRFKSTIYIHQMAFACPSLVFRRHFRLPDMRNQA